MARTFKEDLYNSKRNEILDFAMSLVISKGYAQMTIQDILNGLSISRGALYHYFDSKQAMLEALVARMGKAAVDGFLPILEDPRLDAIQKFRRYFVASAQWKNAGKALIASTLGLWYAEENAVFRQKMSTASIKGTARILEPMIRQGIEEKVFTVVYPEPVAEIIAGVALTLVDSIIDLMIAPQPDPSAYQKLDRILAAYFDTIERILGAPAGSLKVFDAEAFKDWFAAAPAEPASRS